MSSSFSELKLSGASRWTRGGVPAASARAACSHICARISGGNLTKRGKEVRTGIEAIAGREDILDIIANAHVLGTNARREVRSCVTLPGRALGLFGTGRLPLASGLFESSSLAYQKFCHFEDRCSSYTFISSSNLQ